MRLHTLQFTTVTYSVAASTSWLAHRCVHAIPATQLQEQHADSRWVRVQTSPVASYSAFLTFLICRRACSSGPSSTKYHLTVSDLIKHYSKGEAAVFDNAAVEQACSAIMACQVRHTQASEKSHQ